MASDRSSWRTLERAAPAFVPANPVPARQRHECRCGTLKRAPRLLSALICTLPLLSQAPPAADPVLAGDELKWFQLTETRLEVRRSLGPPKEVVSFGDDFESWQYQIDFGDEGEYSHLLVFRRSSGELISVTRNYERERSVDALFPEGQTTVRSSPDTPQFKMRFRRLPGARVLMAMGVAAPGEPAGQIVLMRESELGTFYPWMLEPLRN